MAEKIAVYKNPVWRDKADFIIMADLSSAGLAGKLEQLWAKRLNENTFEICCIPFFTHGIALGNHVQTSPSPMVGKRYVISQTIRKLGMFTFRVWFNGDTDEEKAKVLQEIWLRDHLFEWSSSNLLAISAVSSSAQSFANYLGSLDDAGGVIYETGQ